MLNAIVCIDDNWNIGSSGDLLEHIPEDMKRFKDITKGNIVVMGRKTYESIGHALPDRYNVVFSRDINFQPEDCIIADSYEDMMEKLSNLFREKLDDMNIFVIGGANIYKMLFDKIDYFMVTRIFKIYDNADVNIAELEERLNNEFKEYSFGGMKTYNGLRYCFETYKR